MFQLEDKKLIVDTNEIVFQRPIGEAIELMDVIVVRLTIETQEDDIRNVFGVSKNSFIWKIQEFKEYNVRYDSPRMAFEIFTGIDIYPLNQSLVIGTTAGGFRFLIDPLSGKIVGEESWVK